MRRWVIAIAWGALIGTLALIAAFISAGAGHGDYVAARLLFPFSMLLTLIDGSIGALSLSVALVQFPLYGALLSWAIERNSERSYATAMLVAVSHFLAAAFCFSGALSNFS